MSLHLLSLVLCCIIAWTGACSALADLLNGTIPKPQTAQQSTANQNNSNTDVDRKEIERLQKALEAQKQQLESREKQLETKQEQLEDEKKQVKWLKGCLQQEYKKQEGWTRKRMQLKGMILKMSAIAAACGKDGFASNKKIKALERAADLAAQDDGGRGKVIAELKSCLNESQEKLEAQKRDDHNSGVVREHLQETINQYAREVATARDEIDNLGTIIASYAVDQVHLGPLERVAEASAIDLGRCAGECHEIEEVIYNLNFQGNQLSQRCLMLQNMIQQLMSKLSQYEGGEGNPLRHPSEDTADELRQEANELQEKLEKSQEQLEEAQNLAQERLEGLQENEEDRVNIQKRWKAELQRAKDLSAELQEVKSRLTSSEVTNAF